MVSFDKEFQSDNVGSEFLALPIRLPTLLFQFEHSIGLCQSWILMHKQLVSRVFHSSALAQLLVHRTMHLRSLSSALGVVRGENCTFCEIDLYISECLSLVTAPKPGCVGTEELLKWLGEGSQLLRELA